MPPFFFGSIQTEGFEQQPANNWKGVFSISSYTQYFNVDTDIVLNRLLSSLYPIGGDFFSKIDANPDLLVLFFICIFCPFHFSLLGMIWDFAMLGICMKTIWVGRSYVRVLTLVAKIWRDAYLWGGYKVGQLWKHNSIKIRYLSIDMRHDKLIILHFRYNTIMQNWKTSSWAKHANHNNVKVAWLVER